MKNQLTYVLQGILLTFAVIIMYNLFSFFLSTRFTSESISTKSDDYTVCADGVTNNANVEGQRIFYTNCASCHSIHKRLTGPALAGFEQRGPWKDRKQVYAWIRNPQAFMKRNAYTRKLLNEYQVMMTPFPGLSDKEIDALIDHVNRIQYQPVLPIAMQF